MLNPMMIVNGAKAAFKHLEFFIIAGLLVAYFIKGGEVSRLRSEVAFEQSQVVLLKSANDLNFKTIERLREWDALQSEAFLKLDRRLGTIQTRADEINNNLSDLGRSDEEAQNFLRVVIPDSVKRLLNETGNDGGANRSHHP